MKKIILAGAAFAALMSLVPAQAADIPRAPPPSYKAPVLLPDAWSWTGFYIGGNGGYSFGRSRVAGGGGSFDMNGYVAGGQVGYNWQIGRWVFGVEGDFQATGQDGSITGVTAFPLTGAPATAFLHQELNWFGTARGRLGIAIAPTVLLYGTGGYAVGRVETNGVVTDVATAVALATNARTTRSGWTGGGGIEARLWGNWTAKIEYLYLDLGRVRINGVDVSEVTDHIVRAGINYKFDWGAPITARY